VPLYEFYCEPCDGVFELLRSIREASEPAPCPVCNRDAKRMMPSSFNAFTFRDGYPRRIPDKGTYWHLGKEVKNLITGPVRPNEHPEINKPEPKRRPLKGDAADATEAARLAAERKVEAEVERQAAIQAYDKEQAKKKRTADAL
jgi:putative FmdB family regulatory protein